MSVYLIFTAVTVSPGEIANGKSGRQLMPGLLLLRDNNYTGGNQNMYQGWYYIMTLAAYLENRYSESCLNQPHLNLFIFFGLDRFLVNQGSKYF